LMKAPASRPQPSSSFRGAAAAGICVQLVWSAASSGLPASPTSCSRPIRPVTSIPRPFTPHQPARPAASAVSRAQWMRMPAGALGRHPGSCAIRTAGLSWHWAAVHQPRPAAAARRQHSSRGVGAPRLPLPPSWRPPPDPAISSSDPQPSSSSACFHRDHVAIRCARRRRRRAHS